MFDNKLANTWTKDLNPFGMADIMANRVLMVNYLIFLKQKLLEHIKS